MARQALIVCILTLTSTSAVGLPKSHSPFFPEENHTLELDACSTSRDISNFHPPEGTVLFASDSGTTLTLRMSDFHYVVEVGTQSGGRGGAVNVFVDATTPDDVLPDAVCADLNSDGETDFVVTLWLHGNGLGASFFDRLVALSAAEGYRFWVVPTMTPSADDFVTFGELEPVALVTTGWANTGGMQEPPHSYFVYDLWTFRAGDMVPANDMDARFPKWVWATTTENHKPSRSLSDDMKSRLRTTIGQPYEARR